MLVLVSEFWVSDLGCRVLLVSKHLPQQRECGRRISAVVETGKIKCGEHHIHNGSESECAETREDKLRMGL